MAKTPITEPPDEPAGNPRVGAERRAHEALLRLVMATRQNTRATGNQTQTRILNDAIRLFAVRGYGGTSMRDIASAGGIKAASIYEYFSCKEDLLHASLLEVLDRFHDHVLEGLDIDSAPEDQLQRIVEHHLTWQLGHADIAGAWDILADDQRASEILSPQAREDLERKRTLYYRVVAALVEAAFPGPAAGARAAAIIALCNRAPVWGHAIDGDDEEVAAFAIEFAHAIATAPVPAPAPVSSPRPSRGRTRVARQG